MNFLKPVWQADRSVRSRYINVVAALQAFAAAVGNKIKLWFQKKSKLLSATIISRDLRISKTPNLNLKKSLLAEWAPWWCLGKCTKCTKVHKMHTFSNQEDKWTFWSLYGRLTLRVSRSKIFFLQINFWYQKIKIKVSDKIKLWFQKIQTKHCKCGSYAAVGNN